MGGAYIHNTLCTFMKLKQMFTMRKEQTMGNLLSSGWQETCFETLFPEVPQWNG